MRFLTYYFFILANLIIANDKGMDLFNNGNYKEAAEYYSSILKERGEDNAASLIWVQVNIIWKIMYQH